MAVRSGELSVSDIQEIYGIKPSTAYKWKKFLQNNSMEISQENCDRIHSRELNLSSETVAIEVVKESKPVQIEEPQPSYNANQLTPLGVTVGRLEELNRQVELEVNITEKLRELHQSRLQSEHSKELQQKIQEVNSLDPKNLESMLNSLGIAS